ncbi:porin family protein [Mucilaginibacter sp. PAMB04274]|uniref:porin family protein n=1 Tax=Mucilaginibacter sp. PAMB04274 TaxID=3138568 RepID=UPI0031F6B577
MRFKMVLFYICVVALSGTITKVRAQTRFNIQAGVNFSDVSIKGERSNKANTATVSGLRVGVNAEVSLSRQFSIQPALFYSRKGYQQEDGVFGSGGKATIKADYIELPVTLIFKPELLGRRLHLGAGPYLGYGIGGSWKSATSPVIGDIVVGNKGDVIFRNDSAEGGNLESYVYGKSLDYGVSLLAAYEVFSGLIAQVNSQLGLANLVPEFSGTQLNGSLKNKNWGIALTYKF